MHADPARGVVDADCRVHGISNLHVAGSSVFPTGGYANPTLTIAALAIRLADQAQGPPESPGGLRRRRCSLMRALPDSTALASSSMVFLYFSRNTRDRNDGLS